MPWPMTLAPTKEAIRHENRAEKILLRKKNYCNDLGGHARCKDRITINREQDFVRVGERGKELMVLTYLFFIYRISSVNGFTLLILSRSILVLHWILICPFVWTVVIAHGSLPYVLEPSREGTYVTYPYCEFHEYRVLVSQLAGNHPIPVTHRFHVFPRGAISPDR